MHFWIDKRSQTYGFGRARVAASLSGAGGNGLGFPHPPRRMGGKTSLMPTIHRLPPQHQQQLHSHSHGHQQQQQQQSTTIDCHRSHSINNNNNNNNNNAHNSNHSHSNNNHPSNSNYSSCSNNNVASNNNNNNNNYSNSSGSGTIVHYSTNRTNRGCRSSSINNATLSNNNHHEATTTLTTSTSRSYHHHPQFGNMSIRHYQTQQSATTGVDHSPYATRVHHHHHNTSQRTHSSANSATTVTSVSLPPIYVSPSHALEEGAMGMGPISTVRLHSSNTPGAVTTTTTTATSTANNPILDSTDTQVLPSHLKYGMWATLILASVFVAGAKFYADHQGTGLEVLIFAAFSATFFLAACTVSLCRLPSSLAASPSLSIDDSNRGLLNQQNNQFNIHYQPAQQHQQENLELTPTGAPPPYHIAILLPENGKELQFKDESPPPSYDKIVI